MIWKTHNNCWVRYPYAVAEDDNFRYECMFRNEWFATVQSKELRAVFTTRYENISFKNKQQAISWCESFDPLKHKFKGKDSEKVCEIFGNVK